MNYLLRKIKALLWEKYVVITSENLQEFGKELEVEDNALSVYLVSSDKIELATIALASNRESVQKVEYSLIKLEDFEAACLELREIPADTPYEEANPLHRDIVISNDNDLLKVANLIKNGEQGLKIKPDVKDLLKKAHKENKLNVQKMKPKLRKELGIK